MPIFGILCLVEGNIVPGVVLLFISLDVFVFPPQNFFTFYLTREKDGVTHFTKYGKIKARIYDISNQIYNVKGMCWHTNYEKLKQYIENNPPVIITEAFYNDKNSPVQYKLIDYVIYGSWDIISTDEFKEKGRYFLKIKNDFEIAENLVSMIEEQKASAPNYMSQKPDYIHVIPCIYEFQMNTVCGQKDSYYKFMRSTCGQRLYSLLTYFGLSIIMENIYFNNFKVHKVHVKRKLSLENDLRYQCFKAAPGGNDVINIYANNSPSVFQFDQSYMDMKRSAFENAVAERQYAAPIPPQINQNYTENTYQQQAYIEPPQ